VRTVRINDLCDKAGNDAEATDELSITVGTTPYHADLCEKHQKEMAKRVDAVVNFMVSGKLSAPAPKTAKRPASVSYTEVKAWALGQGMKVNERGRPSQKVVDAFLAAKKKR